MSRKNKGVVGTDTELDANTHNLLENHALAFVEGKLVMTTLGVTHGAATGLTEIVMAAYNKHRDLTDTEVSQIKEILRKTLDALG